MAETPAAPQGERRKIIFSGIQPTGVLADLVQWLDTGSNYLFLAAALVAVVALIYVASAFVAAKLYEKREF